MWKKIITLETKLAPQGATLFEASSEYKDSILEILKNFPSDIIDYNEDTKILKYTVFGIKMIYWSDSKPRFGIYSHTWEIKDPDDAQILSWFYYTKPSLKSSRTNSLYIKNIKHKNDIDPRYWYIPLCISEESIARPNNHLDKMEIWIFCYVKEWDVRTIKFFPKSLLSNRKNKKLWDRIFWNAQEMLKWPNKACNKCGKEIEEVITAGSIIPNSLCSSCKKEMADASNDRQLVLL